MTSFVEMWVTSSAVQQNVLVSQNAGENGRMLLLRRLQACQPGCSSSACVWPRHPELIRLLDRETLRRQSAQVLIAQKENRVILIQKIIAFTQPKSQSVTDPAAPLFFFHSPDSDMVLWREHIHFSWLLCLSFWKSAQLFHCVSQHGFFFNICFRKHTPTAAQCSL